MNVDDPREAEVERITRAGQRYDSVGDVGPDQEDIDALAAIDAGDEPHANGTANGVARPRPKWRTSAQRARAIAEAPPPRRLPTAGMPTLDLDTRNGVPEGAGVTIAGAPGSCKTALALQWAHEWALAGARIAVLCTDQAPEKGISRLGERIGFARDELEGLEGEDTRRRAWRDLSRDLGELPNLVFLDGGEDGQTIEDAAEVLDVLPGEGPRVLIVDSIQEATCGIVRHAAEQGLLSRIPRREQIDAAGRSCRRLTRRGVLVIQVSEQSRGAYGSSDERRKTTALASSKESGSLEYRTDLLLALRRRKNEPDEVDVECPKSRLGQELDFRLRIERARANLVEIPREPDKPKDSPQASVRAEVQRDAAELAKVLAQHPSGLGARLLRAEVRAAGLGWGSGRIDAALAALRRGVGGSRAVDRTPATKGRTWALVHEQEASNRDGA